MAEPFVDFCLRCGMVMDVVVACIWKGEEGCRLTVAECPFCGDCPCHDETQEKLRKAEEERDSYKAEDERGDELLSELEADRIAWQACAEAAEERLNNLLAIIHRDGGHYVAEHGIEKAVTDAHEVWAKLQAAEERASLGG